MGMGIWDCYSREWREMGIPAHPTRGLWGSEHNKDFQKMKIVKNEYVLRQPEQYEEQWGVWGRDAEDSPGFYNPGYHWISYHLISLGTPDHIRTFPSEICLRFSGSCESWEYLDLAATSPACKPSEPLWRWWSSDNDDNDDDDNNDDNDDNDDDTVHDDDGWLTLWGEFEV